MSRIRNAIFRFSGPSAVLEQFRDTLLRSLMADPTAGDFEETGDAGSPALRFAACDGLPFPVFASASGAYPDVEISARWDDSEAGRSFSALIRGGTVTQVDASSAGTCELAAYLRMSGDGRLLIALCVTPAVDGEPRLGCVVTAERDGMFMLRADGRSDAELLATGDDLSWSRRWTRSGDVGAWGDAPLQQPQSIDAAHRDRLNDLADRLLREWLWYAEGDPVENAVEIERFRLYGFVPAKANVRSAGIKRMAKRAGEDGEVFEYDSLDPDERWIRDALERCWMGA